MSQGYAVLLRAGAPRGESAPEDWQLLPEGFAWLAFAFPAIWLLVHGLWTWALVAFLAPLPFLLAGPIAYLLVSFAVGLFAAFEGRERVIVSRETRGWRHVGSIQAASWREAEDKLAVLATRGGLGLRASRAARLMSAPA